MLGEQPGVVAVSDDGVPLFLFPLWLAGDDAAAAGWRLAVLASGVAVGRLTGCGRLRAAAGGCELQTFEILEGRW